RPALILYSPTPRRACCAALACHSAAPAPRAVTIHPVGPESLMQREVNRLPHLARRLLDRPTLGCRPLPRAFAVGAPPRLRSPRWSVEAGRLCCGAPPGSARSGKGRAGCLDRIRAFRRAMLGAVRPHQSMGVVFLLVIGYLPLGTCGKARGC